METASATGAVTWTDRLLKPIEPPYDPLEMMRQPFARRAPAVCAAWGVQGYGAPAGVYVFYAVKMALYIAGWRFFCAFGPEASWLSLVAFQKAILWSMLFEGLGLGCGSGPLTGRYVPPLGGFLYFLRPGTTKVPLLPSLPVLGGIRRTWLDVGLYGALLLCLVRALVAPAIDSTMLWPVVVLVPVLGLCDRTLFLALRAEHYWTTAVCFLFAGNWIAGAKAVQLALWFWAGFSKLNHHFPSVVCVMVSNSPVLRWAPLRRRLYRHYPDDMRPSRLAQVMGHCGTAMEFGVALLFASSPQGALLVAALVLMICLHSFIVSNVPASVPLEWNVMVAYGAFALFWAHPDVSIFQLGSAPVALFLGVVLVTVPLLGNLFPERFSFLVSMRYYAGNWPYGIWLFRGESYRKLEKLKTSSAWVYDQLAHFYDRRTAVGLVGKVLAFRLMHLHGRALSSLLPKAVERLEDYEWLDGEVVGGLVIGWNFGDGHLHREALLRAVQAQCGFEEGELRCIFVEAQPFLRDGLAYRIHDAKRGLLERGALSVAHLRGQQPWGGEKPTDARGVVE